MDGGVEIRMLLTLASEFEAESGGKPAQLAVRTRTWAFDAVEIDNLDSFLRSDGRLTIDDNINNLGTASFECALPE